jgi:HAMP domain-containing protein
MSRVRTFVVAVLIGLVIGAVVAQILESRLRRNRDD